METISSVSWACHSLGLPLEAGNTTNREQGLAVSNYWETSNNTDIYLENIHFSFSLLSTSYFQTSNRVLFSYMKTVFNSYPWPHLGSWVDTLWHCRFMATFFKVGCPGMNIRIYKRPFTVSLIWDFDRIWVPASDANCLLSYTLNAAHSQVENPQLRNSRYCLHLPIKWECNLLHLLASFSQKEIELSQNPQRNMLRYVDCTLP